MMITGEKSLISTTDFSNLKTAFLGISFSKTVISNLISKAPRGLPGGEGVWPVCMWGGGGGWGMIIGDAMILFLRLNSR